mgnify:CR=1 FL=1
MNRHSDISSDEDQRELVDNLMERQCYSIKASSSPRSRRSFTPESPEPVKRRKSITRVKVGGKKEVEKVEKEKEEKPKQKKIFP